MKQEIIKVEYTRVLYVCPNCGKYRNSWNFKCEKKIQRHSYCKFCMTEILSTFCKSYREYKQEYEQYQNDHPRERVWQEIYFEEISDKVWLQIEYIEDIKNQEGCI